MVIPALNEAGSVEAAVLSAAGPEVEVIVVDAQSSDGTPELARGAGARVLNAQRGRARQLQVGFEASESDVVLFLHADTRLPQGWGRAVAAALDDPETVGGAFRLRFDERALRIRLVEWAARLRIALLGFPFGDQAIFVRRRVLDELGGVPDVPVMEDVDLVHAMKKRGRLALLREPATTSARRYFDGGIGRVSLIHFFAFAAWAVGVDRQQLAGWLRR
ncbi:MAG: glycosyltransferase [bacterium]|nr:glycosyltransferase [bacterium]